MSWLFVVLLLLAAALVVAAEWERLGGRLGGDARRARKRQKRKAGLTLIRTEEEEFVESVQRDLDRLLTTEEKDRRR